MPKVHPRRKDEVGRWLCRWCSQPLSGRRQSYCSEACYAEAWMRLSTAFRRQKVFERDRGVCADCGLDTERLEKLIRKWSSWAKARPMADAPDVVWRRYQRKLERAKRFVRGLEENGFRKCFGVTYTGLPTVYQSLWEADHITPRILGGDDNLENLRTLCLPCHKGASKRLARFRAHNRRLRVPLFPERFN